MLVPLSHLIRPPQIQEPCYTADHFNGGGSVASRPGKVNRFPADPALSGRMAMLHEQRRLEVTAVSHIGSTFTGRILGTTTAGNRSAIPP